MTVEKLKMHSPDLTERNIDRIAELFPTVVTETLDVDGNPIRAVDFDALRQELSDHVVEGPQERYQLDWPGKRAAAFAANAPIAKTLRPVREESVDFDTTKNLFIEGDNLDALKLLQESYLGKVKLIYIDPPYNTGNDFVYRDNFAETAEDYLTRSGQRDDTGVGLIANSESNGRFHTDWLNMMYPRLRLARNMLSDSGMVMISVDDNEVANLRTLCDAVFGPKNFVAQFVWHTKNAARGVPPRTLLMANHEYILVYAREIDAVRFKGLPRDEEDFGNPDNDPRGLWRSESMKATGAQDNHFTISDPSTGRSYHANWAFSQRRITEMLAEGLIIFPSVPTGTPRQKKFIDSYVNDRKAFVTSLGWYSTENATKSLMALFGGKKVFDFPKPLDLLAFLIDQSTSSRSADVVVDFFSGSASTAHAVLQVNAADGGNRAFILAQCPESIPPSSDAFGLGFTSIPEIARERIRRAGDVLQSAGVGKRIDVGFRSLRIDSTCLADVSRYPDALHQGSISLDRDSIKADRSGEDLLFQLLLDWGLDLSLPIKQETLSREREREREREIFRVADNALVACFSEEVSADVVTYIAQLQPLRAVFRDSAFRTDAERINAEQLFRELSPNTEVKTV